MPPVLIGTSKSTTLPSSKDWSRKYTRRTLKIDFVDKGTARCERSVNHESSYPMTKMAGDLLSVAAYDYIDRRGLMDGAPIVVEEYRHMVSTTPEISSTTLKKLCRQMMGASCNWNTPDKALPHDTTLK